MNLLDSSPADWLRAVLAGQPGVTEASFSIPPQDGRILIVTSSGQRLSVTVRPEGNYDFP